MTLLTLKMQTGIEGFAYLNPQDFNDLNLKDNNLIQLKDPDNGQNALLKVKSENQVPPDVIMGDVNLLEEMGFHDDSVIEVEPENRIIVPVPNISIEFSTQDRDPKELFLPEMQRNLIQFIRNYHFLRDASIFWTKENIKLNIHLVINTTDPKCVYKIDETNRLNIKLREIVQKMPFNAILLIDKSGSMARNDVKMDDAEEYINDLRNSLLGQQSYNRKSILNNWFNEFCKNPSNPDNSFNSRLNSIILATISFFQTKISRGFGEKCSFVVYADDAYVLQFKNRSYVEATEFNSEICENLIDQIHNISRFGNTNISSAISKCYQIANDFLQLNRNPLMILLLTDGGPFPSKIDNKANMLHSIKSLKANLNSANIPFVFYTIGIGEAGRQYSSLLTDVATIGQGEFHFVDGIKNLIEWYQRLAQNFSITIGGFGH